MDYMLLHQKHPLQLFLLEHLCNYMLHFYHFLHILLQKYLDMLFLLLLLFQKFYFFRREPFTIIFWPTFSKMSVFRFDISVLQIMLSPTPLRWLDYSISRKNCQKIFVCVLCCFFLIFSLFRSSFLFLLHLCYIYITCILHLFFILIILLSSFHLSLLLLHLFFHLLILLLYHLCLHIYISL